MSRKRLSPVEHALLTGAIRAQISKYDAFRIELENRSLPQLAEQAGRQAQVHAKLLARVAGVELELIEPEPA